jgi:glycosyltransferase involved in cell wall biosynthesis
MNVLYVSDSTTVSGAEIVFLEYSEPLRCRGDGVFGFISRGNPRLAAALRDRGVPFHATGSYSPSVIRTTANPRALFTFTRSFYKVASEMRAVIRARQIDVVHSISYPASLYAAFACRAEGIPQVWHEHNIKRVHSANRLIYRAVGRTCAWVVGPSDAVTSNLGRAGIEAGKLRTVYNGIDLSRFTVSTLRPERIRTELGVAAGELAVGLFGQMLPYKGHRTLIQAAPGILAANPATRFFFVGALENPPYEAELRGLLAASGLAERFTFTGWRGDVPDVMRAMDVVVVGTTTPEPAALALMEGMAMERPLVATATGGTPEIVVDGVTGLLYPPGDAAALAGCVQRLLACPETRLQFGRAGRARVEQHFARARHLEQMFALYTAAVR